MQITQFNLSPYKENIGSEHICCTFSSFATNAPTAKIIWLHFRSSWLLRFLYLFDVSGQSSWIEQYQWITRKSRFEVVDRYHSRYLTVFEFKIIIQNVRDVTISPYAEFGTDLRGGTRHQRGHLNTLGGFFDSFAKLMRWLRRTALLSGILRNQRRWVYETLSERSHSCLNLRGGNPGVSCTGIVRYVCGIHIRTDRHQRGHSRMCEWLFW